ncbi:MAG: DUF4367 domain-containing protein [Ruminococcaceae bacterium]|nr:DUF4367 domain-containing protein [Oscillospiraceae bacterium]
MYKELNNDLFDIMLAKALYEDMELEQANEPPENEIRELFPYTHKQEREARRLRRILKYGEKSPALVYISRAAVILLCTATVYFGLLMIDDGIRAAVGGKVIEIAEKVFPLSYKADMEDVIKEHDEEKGYYAVDFDDVTVADREAAEEEFSIENVEFTYIPEGYEIYESNENEIAKTHIYMNDKNEGIVVEVRITGTADMTVDSERTTKEKISVNGNDAFLFYNYNECSGSIYWGNEIYTVSVYGQIPRETLIKIAEGIKY